MIKSTLGKVMWVGRATVFVVGLAVILALVLGVASTAFGANGDNFLLGNGINNTAKNIATLTTRLTMNGTASAPGLQVTQQSTGTGAKGIGVTVPAGKAPLTVNATAGKATNLNADMLDGQEAAAFATSSHVHSGAAITSGTVDADRIEDGQGSGLDADTIDGQEPSAFRGARAYATVDTLVTLSRTSGFTAVSRPATGIYCLTPVAGIDAQNLPAVVSVEWQNTANPEGNASAIYDTTSTSCAANQFKVRTERQSIVNGALVSEEANDISFSIIVP
jgi:hypothetical protein